VVALKNHATVCCCDQVVYGADKQSWANVRTALRKGEAKDGSVTLVLERRILPATSPAAAAAPTVAAKDDIDISSLFTTSNSS
jgi:hypothetical protein